MRPSLLIPLVFTLLGAADWASACDCIHGTAKEELKRAEAVFLGEVSDIQESGSKEYPRLVTLRVEHYWKTKNKKARSVQVLASSLEAGNCPMTLYSGRNLVYAYRRGVNLVTWTCSRTKPEDEAGQEMKELGRGFAPQ